MLIDRFESSGVARRGETGGGVDASIKNSFDIPLHLPAGWADVQQMLNEAALGGFKRYLRRFAHAALAPMRLQVPDRKTGAMVRLDAERMASIDDALLQSIIVTPFRASRSSSKTNRALRV